MKPTKEELEVLRIYASITHTKENYVWFRQDDEGTYIEYAFKKGAPHDNRCLSWYFSLQPEAIKRNSIAFGKTLEDAQKEIEWRKKNIQNKVGGLYKLGSFTCGHEECPVSSLESCKESWNEYHAGEPFIEEDHICRVGKPAPKCVANLTCSHWTYKEPVKCACWTLLEINGLPKSVSIPMEDAVRLVNELVKDE